MTLKNRPELTADRLREVLSYDPETGIFLWKVTTKRVSAGGVAGSLDVSGYHCMRLSGRMYRAHRLAWLYVHGKWPENEIDHINGVRSDNRISNLRDATTAENRQNHATRRDNTSTVPGVDWHKGVQKWRVRIRVPGKRITVGFFKNIEDASAARARAKAELHTFQPFDRESAP